MAELAQFGAGLARIGQENDSNVEITEESVKMYKDGLECVSFELPSEERTYVGRQFRMMYPMTLNVGDEISLFGKAPNQYDGKYCTFTYQGRSYKIERTQQGGYDADDPSTYYYYGFDQTNNQVKFYSNADRTIVYSERVDAVFYVEEYSAPSYVGCYPEKSVGTVFAVGNGNPSTPSNAFKVDYYGNGSFAGNVTAPNIPTIESATIVSGIGTVNPGAIVDLTVTFTKTFSTAPVVTATFVTSAVPYTADFGNLQLGIYSISTTGCVIRIYNAGGTAVTPGVNYIAMS